MAINEENERIRMETSASKPARKRNFKVRRTHRGMRRGDSPLQLKIALRFYVKGSFQSVIGKVLHVHRSMV